MKEVVENKKRTQPMPVAADVKPYNAYPEHVKARFGGRVQKISIDAKFTCPNRDGTKAVGGCVYCNNESFSPATKVRDLAITEQIKKGIEMSSKCYKNVKGYLAYFQAYSNTYAPLDRLKEIYQEALDVDGVVGLAIGTRPDCIDAEKIDYLAELAKDREIIIEYGLESMYDHTLERINRCHDYQCFVDAVEMTKGRGIKMCVHLIIGFPWENRAQWIETAKVISKLPIDYIKVHQLHIVKNSIMGNEYIKKPFELLSKDEYMDIIMEFIEHLNPDIVIQLLFGSAPAEFCLSERWEQSVSQLNRELIQKMRNGGITQGSAYVQ